MSKLKIFVSYSRKDIAYLEEFNIHTASLKRNGNIEAWTDQEIIPGEAWETTLKHQLETVDIIIFLISPDFIASDYIYDVEIKKALERYEQGEVIIIPVLIRPCDFSSLSLNKFQALPANAKPISTWQNKDEAWLDVLRGIKKIVNSPIQKKHSSNKEATQKTPENKIDTIKTQIANGNIEKAIEALMKITKQNNTDLYNSVIIQSSKLNRLKKEVMNGILNTEQQRISTAKIVNSLLAIADELGLD